jgi:hypothetical protein
MSEEKQVYSVHGLEDNYDAHPSFLRWAEQTRSALIQQKAALREQLQGIGRELAAIEKLIEETRNEIVV